MNAEFQVVPLKSNVVGVKGTSLVLEWRLPGVPNDFNIKLVNLVYNATSLISDFSSDLNRPKVLQKGIEIFSNRLNVSLANNSYKMSLTDLQYTDVGRYALEFGISKGLLGELIKDIGVINISSVNGECGFFYSCIFICLSLKSPLRY